MNQESSLYAHHHFLTQISAERQTTEISTLGRQETTKVTRDRSRRRWHELRDIHPILEAASNDDNY